MQQCDCSNELRTIFVLKRMDLRLNDSMQI